MDNTQITPLKEAAEGYLSTKKMSRSELAKTLAASETAVSQLFNDKYPGDGDKLWRSIARLIGYNMGSKWTVKKTQNLRAIQEMCLDAQQNNKFIALCAETDKGKTTGLQFYCKENPFSYYMLCDVNMTRKEFLNAVLRCMGLSIEGTLYERMNAIIKKLLSAPHQLLILDDAGKLSDNCLRQIQVIYDRTESNMVRHAGLVVAGTEYLEKYINKMADKDKMGFRELRRRIEYWQPLMGVSKEFIAAIAADYGVDDKAAILYLQQISTGYGVLKNHLVNFSDYMSKNPDTDLGQREILFKLTHKAA
jgi:DNA transposition AAA+ family ATPase